MELTCIDNLREVFPVERKFVFINMSDIHAIG